MKLIYMCRIGFKYGGLRERPLTENGGLSERPLTRKTGDFGAKHNKLFLKRGSFRSAQVGKAEQRIVYFLKGVFWSGPCRKSRVFRSDQGRKMGEGRGAFVRHIPVLSLYGSTLPPPLPPPPLPTSMNILNKQQTKQQQQQQQQKKQTFLLTNAN